MITCTIKYVIDPYQVEAFETYAKGWIYMVDKMGGTHHGYWLPHEGPSDIAYAMFSFASLATYEAYRDAINTDADCQKLLNFAVQNRFILSYDRSFTRPVLTGTAPAELAIV